MIKELFDSIKEIVLDYVKHRLFPVTVIILILFSILIRRLFILQIVEGDEHQENFIYKSEKTLTVDPVRGNIYDRNGKLLAYNELSYSVVYGNDANISNYALEAGVSENELKNNIVYETIQILRENDDELYLDFPIERLDSGEYKFTVSGNTLKLFIRDVYAANNFEDLSDERKNATPLMIVDYLCDNLFEISDSYNEEDRLTILAIRYKLWLNRYQQYMPVTIAYDISEESNAAITENSDRLYGMTVSVKSLRKYNYAEEFAHIIGYVGIISDDELKQYNEGKSEDKQYKPGEMIGKLGIEQYGEEYLRGESGYETMYVDSLGKVTQLVESKPSIAGNDIYLTIDADLQKYCYDTLEKEIASILLAKIVNMSSVEEKENAEIPITDVYFGLFNNNILSIDDMNANDASSHEKTLYSAFTQRKNIIINDIDRILNETHDPLYALSPSYQDYMEYICVLLGENDIYFSSLIPKEDEPFIKYTSNETSLYEYLKYAISIEAIDISVIDADNEYYDTDEIYELVCDFVINYLKTDTNFDKLIVKDMIKSNEITGSDVVNLLYEQQILNAEGDVEYAEFQKGVYGAYDFMLRKIKNLDITPAMLALDPCSGSAIVTDPNTGDVLALVSYPGYDNNLLTNEIDADYYNQLLNDKVRPMYSRATQQQTAPGSTYKVISTIAGLNEEVITPYTQITCTGTFSEITPEAHCWIYPEGTHGTLQAEGAIEHSCNGYFYEVGYALAKDENDVYVDSMGIDTLGKYAELMGLNDLSGVELPEAAPHLSDNDAVRSAIGQGTNLFAPIQLARYVTTVANRGTCYNLTLIDKVCNIEGEIILDNKATILHQVELSDEIWDVVQSGMKRVIDKSSSTIMANINIDVAGKTGTAQESKYRPDHAVFISYGPYENPEVAVTCVIPNGYTSGNALEMSAFVYAYMYDPEKLIGAEMSGNTVIAD